MIERIYGWGSGSVSMPRPKQGAGKPIKAPRTRFAVDLVRHLAHDIPWGTLLGSWLLTVAGLLALFVLHSQLPALNRETVPVSIAVRFLETSPDPTPPPIAEPQKPATVEAKRPMAREKAALPPPEPTPPPPSPAVKTKEMAALPPLKDDPPPEPAGEATITLGPPPDLSPPARQTGRDELPGSAVVSFSPTSRRDLDLNQTGLAKDTYRDRRGESKMPEPVRREQVALQKSSETGPLPVSGLSSLRQGPAAEAPLTESMTNLRRTAATAETITPARSSQFAPRPESDAAPSAISSTSVEFFERESPPGLDRNHLVSLTELRTCVDPQAESELRTRLATSLSRPATCRSGGVFFDFHHPESAWSIRVDIYNYEGATFGDRCAALQRAVECSEHARRHPL